MIFKTRLRPEHSPAPSLPPPPARAPRPGPPPLMPPLLPTGEVVQVAPGERAGHRRRLPRAHAAAHAHHQQHGVHTRASRGPLGGRLAPRPHLHVLLHQRTEPHPQGDPDDHGQDEEKGRRR